MCVTSLLYDYLLLYYLAAYSALYITRVIYVIYNLIIFIILYRLYHIQTVSYVTYVIYSCIVTVTPCIGRPGHGYYLLFVTNEHSSGNFQQVYNSVVPLGCVGVEGEPGQGLLTCSTVEGCVLGQSCRRWLGCPVLYGSLLLLHVHISRILARYTCPGDYTFIDKTHYIVIVQSDIIIILSS